MDQFRRSQPGAALGRATATKLPDISDRWQALGSARPSSVPYLLPSNEQESSRQDFQHHVLRFALRGIFAAPLTNPAQVLDVGSGTGRWGMEMAGLFPQSRVTGVDLEPPDVNAQSGSRSLNYTVVRDNVLDGLRFASGLFDYTHMRLMLLAIPVDRWPGVVAELVRVTRPGGWIELMECGLPVGGGPALQTLTAWLLALCRPRGLDPTLSDAISGFLRQAGAREVTVRRVELPVGGQGGRLGGMMAACFTASVESLAPAIVAAKLATPGEVEDVLAAIRFELTQWQYTQPFTIALGQR